jgi:hypothetical protein
MEHFNDEALDDLVDEWHDSTEDLDLLWEYPGMNDEEYFQWVFDPHSYKQMLDDSMSESTIAELKRLLEEGNISRRKVARREAGNIA